MYLACLEGCDPGCRVGHHAEHYRVYGGRTDRWEIGSPAVVALKPGEYNLVVEATLLELERTGANGFLRELCVAHFRYIVLRHHLEVTEGLKEYGKGFKGKLNGIGVNLRYRCNGPQKSTSRRGLTSNSVFLGGLFRR